jgi:hypothetical protein
LIYKVLEFQGIKEVKGTEEFTILTFTFRKNIQKYFTSECKYRY